MRFLVMKNNSINNVWIIYEYIKFLKEVKCLDDLMVDGVFKFINCFEDCIGYLDFRKFRVKYVIVFKKNFFSKKFLVIGEKLSKVIVFIVICYLKVFF